MSTIQKERAKARGTPARWPLRPSLLLLLGFSILYFADVFLRASEKYFWYDELCTVYLCRLPWRQLWQALKAGVDFNPPVLYLLTKAANHWGGEGRIVTRLPAMILYLVHDAPELRPYLYYVHWSDTDPFYRFFGVIISPCLGRNLTLRRSMHSG